MRNIKIGNSFLLILFLVSCKTIETPRRYSLSPAEVLEKAAAEDWREPKLENLIYFYLKGKKTVIIELAQDLAPIHVNNIRKIVQSKYWDGLEVMRSQDNYVVQWGDQDERKKDFFKKNKISILEKIPEIEFEFSGSSTQSFFPIESRDTYADEVGFIEGFPVGRTTDHSLYWMLNCYAMVGVSRDADPATGNGQSLYVITGHAPRHLDRNITLVGRVIQGMEELSALPRGHGLLGFYEKKSQYVPIEKVRMASELPNNKRDKIRLLKTSSSTFFKLIEARKNRKEEWFTRPAGRIDICNVPLPSNVAH